MTPTRLQTQFRAAFRSHPAGVAIVTADSPAGPVAVTVSSLISVSDSPPTIALSLLKSSVNAQAILGAARMAVHFLQRRHRPLAQLCAQRGADKFADTAAWERLPDGTPRFLDVPTWFHARITDRMDLPAASIVAAELLSGEVGEDAAGEDLTMVYLNRRWHGLGPEEPQSDGADQ